MSRRGTNRGLTPKTLSIARQRCWIDDRNSSRLYPVTLKHLPINLDAQPRPERDIDRTGALDDSRRNQIAAERVGGSVIFQYGLRWEHGMMGDGKCGDELQRRRLSNA